jgi:hypothetical protein
MRAGAAGMIKEANKFGPRRNRQAKHSYGS